jgi:transposase
VLDVVPGRTAKALHDWVSARPRRLAGRHRGRRVGPLRGYASALRTSLPDATRVLDAFHVTRLGFAAVDDVRRRVQEETTGHRERRDDPCSRSGGYSAAATSATASGRGGACSPG